MLQMQRRAFSCTPAAEQWYLLSSVVNKKLPECSSMVVRRGFAIANIMPTYSEKKYCGFALKITFLGLFWNMLSLTD